MKHMARKNYGYICFLILTLTGLNGCASVSSQLVCSESLDKHVTAANKDALWGLGVNDIEKCNTDISLDDGIVYYMPKRDIRVNVTVSSVPESAPKQDAETQPINSGLKSLRSPSKNVDIPKVRRNVVVTVVNNIADETLPDTRDVFLLRYNKNLIGENNMAVGVNNFGLLSVSRAETRNKSNEIVANLATDAALIAAGGGIPAAPASGSSSSTLSPLLGFGDTVAFTSGAPTNNSVTYSNVKGSEKCGDGTYSLLLDPDQIPTQPPNIKPSLTIYGTCGINIILERLFESPTHNDTHRIASGGGWVRTKYSLRWARNLMDVIHTQNTLESVPGIFYKQDMPYRVTVYREDENRDNSQEFVICKNEDSCQKNDNTLKSASFIALSPTESKVYFSPITETVFTDNASDVRLVNGIVTSYKENTDSELLALSKMPASALGAYTGAVGQVFSSIKGNLDAQAGMNASQTATLLGVAKLQRCQQAIALNNLAGKSGEALTAAYGNIQAACSN